MASVFVEQYSHRGGQVKHSLPVDSIYEAKRVASDLVAAGAYVEVSRVGETKHRYRVVVEGRGVRLIPIRSFVEQSWGGYGRASCRRIAHARRLKRGEEPGWR